MPDLRPEHLAIVRSILEQHLPGREVRMFGSRAHGPARPFSDLDLVIMGDEPVPDMALVTLREAFGESDLPFRVELVLWTDAPALRDVIAKTSVPIPVVSAKEQTHV